MSSPPHSTDPEQTHAVDYAIPPEPLPLVVRVVAGTATPSQLSLSAGQCRVGAGPENTMVIDDKAVSRRHLELSLVPEGVLVRDLGSRNGTFYREQRVGEITLAPGSRLRLGETELVIESDAEDLDKTSADGPSEYAAMLGKAPAMRRLFGLLQRLEGSLVNVLIEGESGTGKELVARALHQRSKLKDKPFVAINCGALERSLVRSELFGHKKGAFTGATEASRGAFDEANGGTLFLDEVSELPLEVQPVLLRVLESGEFSRVGESKALPVKVRLIAASNRDLKDEVENGSFRADLFYRLMVVKLTVPALRERSEDIPALAEHFARADGLERLPDSVLSALSARAFPGNVRELKHAVLAYSALGTLDPPDPAAMNELDAALKKSLDLSRPYAEIKEDLIQRMTRLYLELLMAKTGGNRSEAARVAGLQRGYLRKLLEKLGIASKSDSLEE